MVADFHGSDEVHYGERKRGSPWAGLPLCAQGEIVKTALALDCGVAAVMVT